MATQPAVRAVQLTKHYPGPRGREAGRKSALEGVSFDIAAGEMVGLLGPNGAGKTTLLKVLATLLFPSSGEVHFGDINVLREPGRARKRLGLVTCDERSFYWRLTGRHNLEFFAALYHVPSRETPARVQELLEVLGLAEAADRPFHGYSAGMKQKLAIARGLLASPEILLYDEPTRSLDALSAQNIRAWIREDRNRRPGTTHLVATNDLREAEQLCDRMLIINRGRLLASGTVEEIHRSSVPGEQRVHRIACTGWTGDVAVLARQVGAMELLEDGRDGDVLQLRARTDAQGSSFSRLLAALLESGATVLHCESERAAFDEVFCSLIKADRDRAREEL